MFSLFFVDRPKFALVISIVISLAGLLAIKRLAGRGISKYYPAASASARNLSGGQRGSGRRIGRGSHRG